MLVVRMNKEMLATLRLRNWKSRPGVNYSPG